MEQSSWRKHCRPIILKVIADVGIEDEKKLRKALTKAYPYGERKQHPYKIWCSEVNDAIELAKKQKRWNQVQLPTQ